MRMLFMTSCALLAMAGAAHAQDVRGVIDNLNRALNPEQQEGQGARERQIREEEERYWRDYYGDREDWRERAERDYGVRTGDGRRGARYDDRDLDRVFRSDGALSLEYRSLGDSDRRRYDEASPGERRRWDDDLAENARERWQRMSDDERRRYLEDVRREEDRMSGSSGRRR